MALSYGEYRLGPGKKTDVFQAPLKVAALQGSIPQDQKWDEAYRQSIWKRYEELTHQAAAEKPDLIVWPETAVPGFLQEPRVEERLQQIVRTSGIPTLVGAPTEDPATGRLFNSALFLDGQGRIVDRYDKIHLVPFGEFVPLKPLLSWLENVVPVGNFSPGRRRTVFQSKISGPQSASSFSVLICFEDLFPGLTRGFVREGARGLLVITNDAWFGRSAASLQHLQASVFRAVEGRVWIGRAANTGWTGFVDCFGRRYPAPGQAARFEPGIAVAGVTSWLGPTLYHRWGDYFLGVCLILVAWPFLPSRKGL